MLFGWTAHCRVGAGRRRRLEFNFAADCCIVRGLAALDPEGESLTLTAAIRPPPREQAAPTIYLRRG
jgi:hypothetical protein